MLFGSFNAFDTILVSDWTRLYFHPSDLPSDGDFVAGHMAFSTLSRAYGTANRLTVLREPISRILSHWLFWRALPDDQLAMWGKWAGYLLQARRPLAEFLSCKDIACQTDNVTVRMLLWPHTLIPFDDFIDRRDDDAVVTAAANRLKQFSFTDVMENPELPTNLGAWLGRPIDYLPINQTGPTPQPLKRPLHAEMVPELFNLIETRIRLDVKLWNLLVSSRISGMSVDSVRQRTLLRNVAWHAWLMIA